MFTLAAAKLYSARTKGGHQTTIYDSVARLCTAILDTVPHAVSCYKVVAERTSHGAHARATLVRPLAGNLLERRVPATDAVPSGSGTRAVGAACASCAAVRAPCVVSGAEKQENEAPQLRADGHDADGLARHAGRGLLCQRTLHQGRSARVLLAQQEASDQRHEAASEGAMPAACRCVDALRLCAAWCLERVVHSYSASLPWLSLLSLWQ